MKNAVNWTRYCIGQARSRKTSALDAILRDDGKRDKHRDALHLVANNPTEPSRQHAASFLIACGRTVAQTKGKIEVDCLRKDGDDEAGADDQKGDINCAHWRASSVLKGIALDEMWNRSR